ncbi:alpha/beta hydrolase [Paenibacillus terrae]|uniref:Alpha/beta hydrolase n=1 Tax=Paenibacillus terrae TaxID=159743 RepID=A0A4U2PTA8_9BACL|nr:alpha/beta hydrolase [Paenibacillus terrae]TKH42627.1 alpha/beta hydrolase [Paenibacillus terrae]
MSIFFEDQAFEFETIRTLNYYNYQGAELGEVQGVANRITEGDFGSWYKEWYDMAEKVSALANKSLQGKHTVSAKEAFLRASNYYRTAEFFLKNDEPIRMECYKKSVDTFRQALQLMDEHGEPINIPFEDGYLSSYLFTVGKDAPTLIFVGGYDSTVEELYFAGGAAALKRGFNVLIFDGPGQGEAIRIQKTVARYDFEKPISAALDYLQDHTVIDTNQFVALLGMSLGGYYAARAAAFEKRINACILFDVFTDVWESISQKNPMMEKLASSPGTITLDSSRLDANTRWLIQNGFWVFGCKKMSELPAKIKPFTVKGIANLIECPTLLLVGTHDHFVTEDQLTYLKDHLGGPYDVHIFDTTFGAQEHCQEGNHSYAHQVMFDWTEEQLLKYKDA